MNLLIFTVAGPDDADLSQDAAINILRSNPSLNITFKIINNSGSNILQKYLEEENITIVDGIPNNCQYLPSIHHSMAVNYFLATVDASKYDYYLLIDPDIIQIQANSIISILTKMHSTNASIYSFPWHLKWYSKFRSRTCPHFFLFSREVLESKILDFSPNLKRKSFPARLLNIINHLKRSVYPTNDNFVQPSQNKIISSSNSSNASSLTQYIKIFSSFFISRLAISSAKDTGHKNSFDFLRKHNFKLLIGGIFIPKFSLQNIYHLNIPLLFFIEKHLIPDYISYLPSCREYIYSDRYKELTKDFDLEIMSIDYKDASFLHLRKFTKYSPHYNINSIISSFVNYYGYEKSDNRE